MRVPNMKKTMIFVLAILLSVLAVSVSARTANLSYNVKGYYLHDTLALDANSTPNLSVGSGFDGGTINLEKTTTVENDLRFYGFTIDSQTSTSVKVDDGLYVTGDTNIDGDLYIAGVQYGLKEANVYTVAKSGGDYSTIQSAIDGCTAPCVILIYPGTYAEEVNIDTGSLALVGVDRYRTIIKKKSADIHLVKIYNSSNAISGITIANMTIDNDLTFGEGGSSAQIAVAVGDPNVSAYAVTGVVVRDCDLEGYQDTTFVYPNSSAKFLNCKITGGFDIGSTWLSTAYYIDCEFYAQHSPVMSGVIYCHGTSYVYNCQFYTISTGSPAVVVRMQSAASELHFYGNYIGEKFSRGVNFSVAGGTAYVGDNHSVASDSDFYDGCTVLYNGSTKTIGDTETILSSGESVTIKQRTPMDEYTRLTVLNTGETEWTDTDANTLVKIWTDGTIENDNDIISTGNLTLGFALDPTTNDIRVTWGTGTNSRYIAVDTDGRIKFYKDSGALAQVQAEAFRAGVYCNGAYMSVDDREALDTSGVGNVVLEIGDDASLTSIELNKATEVTGGGFTCDSGITCNGLRIDANGFFRPFTSADADAPTNSIYFSIDQTKLVYKDSQGVPVVHDLY